MAVIQVLALILVVLYLSYRLKEKIVDVLPVAVSLLVLLLYGLAHIRHLSFLDGVNIGIVTAAGICFLRCSKEKKKEILAFCKRELLHPGCMVMVLTLTVVTICVSDKVVTWWDEYNFWATDVKSLFYLDGFAGKYSNVAAEFGDYPPGTQMMKWWFLHLSPDVFREGLMFAGYYAMNLTFLMPLMRKLPGLGEWSAEQSETRRMQWLPGVSLLLLMPVMLWMFPSVAEEFYLTGSCADLTMGVVYGAFLAAVLDEENHGSLFYYGRLALYLMVLVLLKNTGFLWAGFGIVFLCGYRFLMWKKNGKTVCRSGKKERQAVLLTVLLPILTEGSWLVFCLLMRRVAKLTGTAVRMATGSMQLPDYSEKLVHAFWEAFFTYPLHRWKTAAIDLSPFALYVLLLILTAVMYKIGRWQKEKALFTGIFFALSGAVFYLFNLISHLTIFVIEEQYLEPFGMVSSIERYGAPFTIGGLYVIGFLYLNMQRETDRRSGWRYRPYLPYWLCFLSVFLFADHKMAYEGLIGYRSSVEEVVEGRQEILDGAASEFLTVLKEAEETKKIAETNGMRVLYLRDGRNLSWVQNTYVSFEASPVSVMYGSFLPEEQSEEDVIRAIRESHAEYLYVDDAGTGEERAFDRMTKDGAFCYNTLYKAEWADGEVSLRLCPDF